MLGTSTEIKMRAAALAKLREASQAIATAVEMIHNGYEFFVITNRDKYCEKPEPLYVQFVQDGKLVMRREIPEGTNKQVLLDFLDKLRWVGRYDPQAMMNRDMIWGLRRMRDHIRADLDWFRDMAITTEEYELRFMMNHEWLYQELRDFMARQLPGLRRKRDEGLSYIC